MVVCAAESRVRAQPLRARQGRRVGDAIRSRGAATGKLGSGGHTNPGPSAHPSCRFRRPERKDFAAEDAENGERQEFLVGNATDGPGFPGGGSGRPGGWHWRPQ
jgi:hypothetical protein